MGKIIGIAPKSLVLEENVSCIEDCYSLGNSYMKRIFEVGCTPIGLAPVDKWLTGASLEMCDSFLAQGGAEFHPYHFHILHYAITNGKHYLGI